MSSVGIECNGRIRISCQFYGDGRVKSSAQRRLSLKYP